MSIKLIHGDCLEVLPRLPANSIDAVVTDPPYHLTSIVKRFGKEGSAPAKHGTDGAFARASAGFMGKQWDGGDIAFRPETWAEVYRTMKPGAHLAAFGGTRTFHRMVCAIEDAGFEIRDSLMWIYGTGFPKSHDVERGIAEQLCTLPGRHYKRALPALVERLPDDHVCPSCNESEPWDGFGTALKPAYEPIILARKPLEGTVAGNTLMHGVGGINIDACRIGTDTIRSSGSTGMDARRFKHGTRPADYAAAQEPSEHEGRWPANVIHDGSDEVMELFPNAPGQQGDLKNHQNDRPTKTCFGDMGPAVDHPKRVDESKSAARFFYCAKASKTDRAGSSHPTVKPVSLIRWVSRLITPPGGTILDPFAGSGTTGQAALKEGFNAILIEAEAEYITDIKRRFAA